MKKYALFFQLFYYYKVTEYHVLPATIFQLKVLITVFFFFFVHIVCGLMVQRYRVEYVPDDSQNWAFYPRPVLLQSEWLKMVLQKQFELIVLESLKP